MFARDIPNCRRIGSLNCSAISSPKGCGPHGVYGMIGELEGVTAWRNVVMCAAKVRRLDMR